MIIHNRERHIDRVKMSFVHIFYYVNIQEMFWDVWYGSGSICWTIHRWFQGGGRLKLLKISDEILCRSSFRSVFLIHIFYLDSLLEVFNKLWAESMMDIEINAWSFLLLNFETNLILCLYPEKCIKFNQSEWRIRSREV